MGAVTHGTSPASENQPFVELGPGEIVLVALAGMRELWSALTILHDPVKKKIDSVLNPAKPDPAPAQSARAPKVELKLGDTSILIEGYEFNDVSALFSRIKDFIAEQDAKGTA